MTGPRVPNGGANTGIGRAFERRAFLKTITIALAGMCAGLGSTVGNRPSANAAETLKTLRIGYQKYGTTTARQDADPRAGAGVSVEVDVRRWDVSQRRRSLRLRESRGAS
jgi:hypothetical protein